MRTVDMEFDYESDFGFRRAGCLRELLLDCMLGDPDAVHALGRDRAGVGDHGSDRQAMGQGGQAGDVREERGAEGLGRSPSVGPKDMEGSLAGRGSVHIRRASSHLGLRKDTRRRNQESSEGCRRERTTPATKANLRRRRDAKLGAPIRGSPATERGNVKHSRISQSSLQRSASLPLFSQSRAPRRRRAGPAIATAAEEAFASKTNQARHSTDYRSFPSTVNSPRPLPSTRARWSNRKLLYHTTNS